MFTPDFYTEIEGGPWCAWPIGMPFDPAVLGFRNPKAIVVAPIGGYPGICVHALAFGNVFNPHDYVRWDCINGFTPCSQDGRLLGCKPSSAFVENLEHELHVLHPRNGDLLVVTAERDRHQEIITQLQLAGMNLPASKSGIVIPIVCLTPGETLTRAKVRAYYEGKC